MAPHRTRLFLIFLLGATSPATVTGDEDELAKFYRMSLEELSKVEITTATGNSKTLDRAPATATVITAAEIEALGARTLNEVLETVPGLHVALSSLSRLDAIFSIRGIHSGFNPHVLLLMNGVPVQFNAQGGRPVSFRFPATSIAQIEVIRGPGSAIYGADAFSGVINIITKDGSDIESFRIGGRYGSFGSQDIWLQGGVNSADWNLALTMTYMQSDGDDKRVLSTDLQSHLDQALGTSASLAPAALATNYELLDTHVALNSERWKVNLWSWISDNSGVGAGAVQALDDQGGDDNELYLADIAYQMPSGSDHWKFSLRASYLYYKNQARFNIFPPGTVLPIAEDGNVNFLSENFVAFPDGLRGHPGGVEEDSQFDIVSVYHGFDTHRVRLAVGAKHQALEPSERKNFGPGVIDGSQGLVDGNLTDVGGTDYIYLTDSSRSVRYISLQDEWRLADNWELTTGIRYDDYSDFGGTTNPRVALVWTSTASLTTKLLYGSAFRAPTFTEQFFRNNPVSLGNPDLSAEKIDTVELSFNFQPSEKLLLNLSLFRYRATDMIEYLPDSGGVSSTARNARDQDGEGFEIESAWTPTPHLRFSANYSWHDAEDRASEMDIAEVARAQSTFISHWEFLPNWFFTTQTNWIGNRKRAASDLRPPIDDYTLIDLLLRKNQLIANLDLAIAVRNATNEDAREPSDGVIEEDYPLASRSFSAELVYSF